MEHLRGARERKEKRGVDRETDTQGRFGDARGTQSMRAREIGDQLISDA